MPRIIAGLGGLLSDPSCCILKNGRIASAVEQAKVARNHDRPGAFPEEAVRTALEVAAVQASEIDCIAVARPFAAGAESAAHLALRTRFPQSAITVVEHHDAHAASAYYASAFQEASVLSIDRAGDFRSAVLFEARANRLKPVRELYFPDSFGDLFNRVTGLLGFRARADEHKVQWLSVPAEPKYADVFRAILHANGPSWPCFDRSFFDAGRLAHGGFSARFYDALGIEPGTKLSADIQAEIAASLQRAVEEAAIAMLAGAGNVCIAGGLALNALLIHRLEQRFGNVFVQPAAGNAGTALGAALHAWHNVFGEQRRVPFTSLCLGPAYAPDEIKRVFENCKLRFHYLPSEGEAIERAVEAINDQKIVAWMQGRMEFGPRALGNRSILASPLNPYSTENLNVFIKHRETFRKFAASVPEELADEYFETGPNARYLATVARVKPAHRNTFASALLGADLIRVHTVGKDENPLYHALLMAAGASTGLPVLYNTSFNLFGDPLVCTPRDAVRSFYSSGIDALFAGSFWLEK
ncbi:MAG: carbamoyltransferase C-terminal domain-containing protein [Bryobacteraceae bacterium]